MKRAIKLLVLIILASSPAISFADCMDRWDICTNQCDANESQCTYSCELRHPDGDNTRFAICLETCGEVHEACYDTCRARNQICEQREER